LCGGVVRPHKSYMVSTAALLSVGIYILRTVLAISCACMQRGSQQHTRQRPSPLKPFMAGCGINPNDSSFRPPLRRKERACRALPLGAHRRGQLLSARSPGCTRSSPGRHTFCVDRARHVKARKPLPSSTIHGEVRAQPRCTFLRSLRVQRSNDRKEHANPPEHTPLWPATC